MPLQDFEAPPGALPPLLVKIHGGPTSQASSAFNLGVQYWTSRGGWQEGALCWLGSTANKEPCIPFPA